MKVRKASSLLVFAFCFGAINAQYSVLLNFNGVNSPQGENPRGSLTFPANTLYGMTESGGIDSAGVLFKMNANGIGYQDLHNFNYSNGAIPSGSLTFSNSKLYGMTVLGGTQGDGVIFSIDTNGNSYKDLLDFTLTNGANPAGSLVLSGKMLYGMTNDGGANDGGVVFSIDTNGNGYRDLFDFNNTTGQLPYGSLTLWSNKLYGMTSSGGMHGFGCIFSIDTGGSEYKDLLDFNGTNGEQPFYGSLVLSGKTLYGMTQKGGTNFEGLIFSLDTNGSGYKDLLNFNGSNGENPYGSLILLRNRLYGLVAYGGIGTDSDGIVFSIDTNGNNYIDMFDFTGIDGANPLGNLVFSGNSLYGMTYGGGTNNDGVIFRIDTNAVAGINTLKINTEGINIYPNPSNGLFSIVVSDKEQGISEMQIEVYNILGERVSNETLKQVQADNTIDISSQPNGVYFYRLLTDTDSLIGEGKLIIQK